MKKTVLASVLSALCVAAVSAPIVVTPGSNSGYLWFPKGSSGGPYSGDPTSSGGKAGVTIDGMQLARTACYTTSGAVVLPTGFTTGYIQAIVVGGGQGSGGWGGQPAGQASSITHADIGTITAAGGAYGVAGSAGGANGGSWVSGNFVEGGRGGGGGGYLGKGGHGSQSPEFPAAGGGGGGTRGGGGQGFGYGEAEGGVGGGGATPSNGVTKSPNGQNGSVGMQPTAPAAIMCPNVPKAADSSNSVYPAYGGTGFGAGAAGNSSSSGGNSGQINSVTWKYTGGPITVVVGSGGTGGAPGVVALRFIPQ